MRRREFLGVLSGAAAAWPIAARAQRPAMPVIGFLASSSAAPIAHFMAEFRQGLRDSGYVEGRDVVIEYRWAENRYDRLPAMATELVHRQVAVIVAAGGPVAPLAAKAATSTIPIVFTASSDPINLGLVASLNRPGGNVTGWGMNVIELEPKRLDLLRELAPKARVIGALINPSRSDTEAQARFVQDAGHALGLEVITLLASSPHDIEAVFGGLAGRGIGAILIGADPSFIALRDQLIALAARHNLPAMYTLSEYVAAGGLASYGTNIAEGYRQAGLYVGQILKGAKPSDLPVVQPTKFHLAVNLKTAKALGITIPQSILLQADEVIE